MNTIKETVETGQEVMGLHTARGQYGTLGLNQDDDNYMSISKVNPTVEVVDCQKSIEELMET